MLPRVLPPPCPPFLILPAPAWAEQRQPRRQPREGADSSGKQQGRGGSPERRTGRGEEGDMGAISSNANQHLPAVPRDAELIMSPARG